jgi:hypothetical protein
MSPKPSAVPALLLFLALLVPGGTQAQSVGLRASVGLGADGMGQTRHLYYGGEAGGIYRSVGLLASGYLGSGNGFSSRLVAATPAFRAWGRGRADLFVTAGAGHYRETLESGPARSTTVMAAGFSGRLPAGPVRLAVGFLGFRGSLGPGEGAGPPLSVVGVRFVVGVGL